VIGIYREIFEEIELVLMLELLLNSSRNFITILSFKDETSPFEEVKFLLQSITALHHQAKMKNLAQIQKLP
jgi:hypothetical protein